MAWLRLDPGFSRHGKRIACGPLASWLWVCSMDYSATYLTDGFVPDAAVSTLAAIPRKSLKRCIAALLMTTSWERVEGGYLVHDYLEYNPTADQVKTDREAARQRARKSRGLPPDHAARAAHVPRTFDARAGVSRRTYDASSSLSITTTPASSSAETTHPPARASRPDSKVSHDTHSNNSERSAPTPTPLAEIVAHRTATLMQTAAQRVAALKAAEGKLIAPAPVDDPPPS